MAFGSKKSCLREQDLALKDTFFLLHFTVPKSLAVFFMNFVVNYAANLRCGRLIKHKRPVEMHLRFF